MSKLIVIRVGYDDDAKVWYVTHSDLFGVHAEGDTFDTLVEQIPDVVRDMMAANDSGFRGDVLIEIIAHTSARVAA
jgi:hypothetical protein